MKIVIFNGDLRSEMQMYLALEHKHHVEIAKDLEDLFTILGNSTVDFTFFDLESDKDRLSNKSCSFKCIKQILEKHPEIKLVGVCDHSNSEIKKLALKNGINTIITRPIKNRELLSVLES
jgi:DNA-binding NtrC family response regulator